MPVFAALLLLLFVSPMTAADTTHRFVTVRAQGYVESVPDTLQLSVSVKKTAKSQDTARVQADRVVLEVNKVCRSLGVAADDIDSSQMSAYPEYEWRQQQRVYLGESVARNITITLRDLSQYGPLLARLSKLELQQIHSPQLSHSKLEQLQLQALRNALAAGRLKADTIAGEIDAQLGQVLQVQESPADAPPGRLLRAELASSATAQDGGFSYAKQRITASVEMQFQLQ